MIFVSSKISDGNMDFRFGNPKQTLKNRNKFFKKLKINPKNIIEIEQVHGNKVLFVDTIPDPKTTADGLITNKNKLYLMLKIADCMAISFYNQKNNAIGLAHVGSKGLEKEIIRNTIHEMKKNFNTNPKDLIIRISPSIGPCCYKMDIWKEAKKQLKENGILLKNIDNPKICTYHTNEYFSHRKAEDNNQDDFRFISVLGI